MMGFSYLIAAFGNIWI